jgi:putative membrane protein
VKEKVVAIRKVQAVTWTANWIRKRMGLLLLEYRVAGNDGLKKAQKVQVPVTQAASLPILVDPYYSIPDVSATESLHIHRSYIGRRVLLAGLMPALLLMAVTFYWWEEKSLFFLFIPLLVGINSVLYQKYFRLWAMADVVYLDKSVWGTEKVLLQWYKIQSVRLKQSIYQKGKGLATLTFYTAGGSFIVPFIPLEHARSLIDYSMYKIESSRAKWM